MKYYRRMKKPTRGKEINMRYRFLAVFAALVLTAMPAASQAFSEKRTFHKTVQVSRETSLELDNKYGNIHIATWEKDSVSVRVELEAFASSGEKLRKMFDGVDISITDVSYLVKATTSFNQSINMLFESFKGMTNKIIPYESRIEIDYYVSAPEYLTMRVINRYGDVYMENNTGKFSLELTNGSFKADNIRKAGEIKISFCDFSINKLEAGNINSSFSEVTIGESEDLSITSISSRFDLRKTGSINAESRRDKFFIGTAGSVRGNSYFTDFNIDEISREINLDTKYGNLNADLIRKSADMINVTSGYTDINLTFDPSLAYNLDIRHTNSFVVLPADRAKIEKKTLNEDKNEYMTFGTVGRNPGNVKVVIDATRGNIYLK